MKMYIAVPMFKNHQTEIKWGILFSLMSLFWMFMERMLGWHQELISVQAAYTNFIALPAIAIYVAALIEKRNKDYGGAITYQQALFSGISISVVVMILSPVVQVISFKFISPHFFENAIHHKVSTGVMKQDAAEGYYNLSSFVLQGLVGAPVMGFITSVVVALFVRRKVAATS